MWYECKKCEKIEQMSIADYEKGVKCSCSGDFKHHSFDIKPYVVLGSAEISRRAVEIMQKEGYIDAPR